MSLGVPYSQTTPYLQETLAVASRPWTWQRMWINKGNFPSLPDMEVPQTGWFIMDNPMKMNDLGKPPRLRTPTYIYNYIYTLYNIQYISPRTCLQNWSNVGTSLLSEGWNSQIPCHCLVSACLITCLESSRHHIFVQWHWVDEPTSSHGTGIIP